MIQLKIILFGLTLVGAAALAIYQFYNEQEAPQQYGPNRNRQRRMPSQVSRRTSNQSIDYSSGPMSLPDCSICIFPVSDDIYGRKLFCGHIFHKKCIIAWLEKQRTCPNCRMPV